MRLIIGFLFGCVLLSSAPAVEKVASTAGLVTAMRAAELGDAFPVEGRLFGDSVSGTVHLQRIELRAPGATVRVIAEGRASPLDYPRRQVFSGRVVDRPSVRVGLLFDPVGLRVSGAVIGPDGIRSLGLSGDDGLRITATEPAATLPAGVALEASCGNVGLDQSDRMPVLRKDPMAGLFGASARGSLRYGVLAIDTDAEWLNLRFGDDTVAAAEWLEDLLVITNTLFEAQLSLHMLQGDTYLRVGTDPYSETGSPANFAQLQEFGTYWANNFGGVQRTHAALVSGQSSSEFSASGIAWVDSYCVNQSSGGSYSVNQLFQNAGVPVASSARLFAHELGHNLGSVHTHCYDPPVDQCYAQESGCYSGATSCPSGGAGTLMSYCNVNGCGENQLLLAPEVEAVMNQRVDANTPACLAESNGDLLIFSDRFEF
ncbi:M12 family metallo-peptidase [Wenzhouxiangella sediminis]|uniref:Peptidase M12B domain-containing protein n=1 Tax=Wenzhouxiangella sediminis TaxID=1792836 RepID=A0A3E1KCG8_9GAMM|nr:M12 family metallo-peptidase [Wenzhouxiangella sediminis]RFF32578.1 hypothetical protein DZC52_01140 [Wenzhouxiangella sediminis]